MHEHAALTEGPLRDPHTPDPPMDEMPESPPLDSGPTCAPQMSLFGKQALFCCPSAPLATAHDVVPSHSLPSGHALAQNESPLNWAHTLPLEQSLSIVQF